MNVMKIGKKIEVELLNLKFLIEKLDILEKQHIEGSNDLYFRLSHFRKRISNKKKYDKFFFGTVSLPNEDEQKKETLKDCENKSIPWIKKVYRDIVTSTHPDKFVNFPVENLKQKYLKIYRDTINAWKEKENDKILLCAYETGIKIENPDALSILTIANTQKKQRYKEIQKFLGYQWFHVPEQKKKEVLEKYLKDLGYEFTTIEVEKVINIPRKRKVGTRPIKLRRFKNVK